MAVFLHSEDLPHDLEFEGAIAVDTEAMGLYHPRDRLCMVQLSDGQGDAHLVQFERGRYHAPNLCALLTAPRLQKIFHFARFDVSIIQHYLGVMVTPIFCTKIASKLARTYTDTHGLKDLCREFLNITISKQQQSSDWGADFLSKEQMEYAAADVLYLHRLRDKLVIMLERENRLHLAEACFQFLPTRAALDLQGWYEKDIFSHT